MSNITPGVEDYTLGRGKILFNRKNADGTYQGIRDLGNAPDFKVSISVDKNEHYSSRTGLKTKDKTVITGMNPTASFTLDMINSSNMAMTFMATDTAKTQAILLAQSKVFASVEKGFYYDIGAMFISGVVVAQGAVTFVLGTDYTIDARTGLLFVMAGSTMPVDVSTTVTYDIDAATYQELNAFNESSVNGQLIFISDVAEGTNTDAYLWDVSLTPSGDFNFISGGDDWTKLEYGCEINKDATGHPLYPYMRLVVTQ